MDERRETVPGVRFIMLRTKGTVPPFSLKKYFCSPCLFFSCEVCFL